MVPGTAAAARSATGFRGDVQGLRAVAVLLVALGHAGVPGLEGGYIGVDVFFVISGFLITGLLLRRSARAQRVPFREFYAARARRILPAATLVLVATAIASRVLLNFVRARSALHDSIWATFFAANVHFARTGTDYFAQGTPASPIQHFWSLAVEEQFYLVFPALILLVLFLLRSAPFFYIDEYGMRRRGHIARQPVDDAAVTRLTAAIGLCVAGSFAWSVYNTSSNPTGAYFSTFARAWELGVGALVAVAAVSLARIPVKVRELAGWLGLAGVLLAAFTFDANTQFPGYAAALPVVSTALLLTAGIDRRQVPVVSRVMEQQPLRLVGDVSYSFYLWHWPVLIIAAGYAGHDLSVAQNLGLVAGAFALSVITFYSFERPLHIGKPLAPPRRALVLWPVALATVLVVVGFNLHAIDNQASARASDGGTPDPILTVPVPTTLKGQTPPTGQVTTPLDPYKALVTASVTHARLATHVPNDLTPPIDKLADGQYDAGHCGAGFGKGTSSDICNLGDANGSKSVVVFGDSHARMWMPVFLNWAQQNHWKLIPIFKEGCVAATFGGGNARDASACLTWYKWAVGQVQTLHPNAVILSESYSQAALFTAATDQALTGMQDEITKLAAATQRLVVIEDIPYQSSNPVDCLLKGGATLGSCTVQFTRQQQSVTSDIAKDANDAHARFVPTLQWFCANDTCPMVVGNTIAYRDQGHISPAYALTLAPAIGSSLITALN